jgi:hypothetical protein
MNPESQKCSQVVRQIPLERFRLPSDGRKWKQVARSRIGLLLRLSGYANGDGTFERDGRNYSPSEKTLAKHVEPRTYYRLTKDLRRLGLLSWTREQRHYGRRTFTIHLPNSPETPARFDEKHLPDSETPVTFEIETPATFAEHLTPATGDLQKTPDTRANNPSFPITAAFSGSTTEHRSETRSAAVGEPMSARSVADHLPSNPSDGTEGVDHSVRVAGSRAHTTSQAFSPTPEQGVPPAPPVKIKTSTGNPDEPMDAQTKRRIRQSYAVAAKTDWNSLPQTVKDRVNAVVKKCALSWEHSAAFTEDGEPIADEDRELPPFEKPEANHKLKIAQFLDGHTDSEFFGAWKKFLNRPRGFEGLSFVWANFVGGDDNPGELEIYADAAIQRRVA